MGVYGRMEIRGYEGSGNDTKWPLGISSCVRQRRHLETISNWWFLY